VINKITWPTATVKYSSHVPVHQMPLQHCLIAQLCHALPANTWTTV